MFHIVSCEKETDFMVVVNVLLLVFFHVLVTGMFLDLSFWNWIGVIIFALLNNSNEGAQLCSQTLCGVGSIRCLHLSLVVSSYDDFVMTR